MTEAMPFLQKYDITFLRPPTICGSLFDFCGINAEFRAKYVLIILVTKLYHFLYILSSKT